MTFSPTPEMSANGINNSAGTTVAVTTTAPIPAGRMIFFAAIRSAANGDNGITSITKTAGGSVSTWQLDIASCRASNFDIELWSAVVNTAIPSGVTFTGNFLTTSAKRAAVLASYAGLVGTREGTSGAVNGAFNVNYGLNGSSSNPTASASNTTPDSLVLGIVATTAAATASAGTGCTLVGSAKTTTGSSDRGIDLEAKVVSAAGSQSAPWSLTASIVWAAGAATYPIQPVAAPGTHPFDIVDQAGLTYELVERQAGGTITVLELAEA